MRGKRRDTHFEKEMNHPNAISNWVWSVLLFMLTLLGWEADPGARANTAEQQQTPFIQCLLCARHFSKHFTWINLIHHLILRIAP